MFAKLEIIGKTTNVYDKGKKRSVIWRIDLQFFLFFMEIFSYLPSRESDSMKTEKLVEHYFHYFVEVELRTSYDYLNFLQVPVVDGYSFPHLTKRMNVAGRHITSYLVDLLLRRG